MLRKFPVNIVGASFQHPSLPLSAQRTLNMYPEVTRAGQSALSMHSTPGCKLFSEGDAADKNRGAIKWQGSVYFVGGSTFYKLNPNGTREALGAIAGNAHCTLDTSPTAIVISSGGSHWFYDGELLSPITDPDLESFSASTIINNQAVFGGGVRSRWASADAGDVSSIRALNYANTEMEADFLVRPYAYQQLLYLFGEYKGSEVWWNSNVGNPPFSRQEVAIGVGLGALHSLSSNNKHMYFLGQDRRVYRMAQYAFEPITTIAMHDEFMSFDLVDDAIGFCFTDQDQDFYQLTFPTVSRTFVYSYSANDWFEKSAGVFGQRDLPNAYVDAYGKHLVFDYRNGNVYEWDHDTFTNNGDQVQRIRSASPIHAGMLNPSLEGYEMMITEFGIEMEAGVGLMTGQGSDPLVSLRLSKDGGKTWGVERNKKVGKLGQFRQKIEWKGLGGNFQTCIPQLLMADPIPWHIYKAWVVGEIIND